MFPEISQSPKEKYRFPFSYVRHDCARGKNMGVKDHLLGCGKR